MAGESLKVRGSGGVSGMVVVVLVLVPVPLLLWSVYGESTGTRERRWYNARTRRLMATLSSPQQRSRRLDRAPISVGEVVRAAGSATAAATTAAAAVLLRIWLIAERPASLSTRSTATAAAAGQQGSRRNADNTGVADIDGSDS
ncbi:hypothetical protein BDY21DRAFT_376600 [Lineolata rhizophorae]|uniref:Uncharacterized protein n=1 Tax=Lineolata rhizophorae TaxID=578093 RepID=A0A6A6PCM9_9PEZI|nr:hypothetical protein BDY21DRAFT_376600 [Lineolata rhizophorae]